MPPSTACPCTPAPRPGLHRQRIRHGVCIDGQRLGRLVGCPSRQKRTAASARLRLRGSVDIGAYNTCVNGAATAMPQPRHRC
ncbi:MAG: hypothetical protein ACLRSY_01950 [Acutalibacter sp.]